MDPREAWGLVQGTAAPPPRLDAKDCSAGYLELAWPREGCREDDRKCHQPPPGSPSGFSEFLSLWPSRDPRLGASLLY